MNYTENKILQEDIVNIIDRLADINSEDLCIKNSDDIAMAIINHLVESSLML